MLPMLAAVAGVSVIVGSIGLAVALVARRGAGGRDHVLIAVGLLGIALAAFVAFLGYWANPVLGVVLTSGIVAVSLGYNISQRAWRYWRKAVPLALLAGGILLVYFSLLYFWSSELPIFTLAAQRFSQVLPIDNVLPTLFSERLGAGESTHNLVDGWNGSDRPPLQSGLILLVSPASLALSAPNFGVAANFVAELLWIPALFAFLRALGLPRGTSTLGALAAAVAGTTLVNTLYTWPKMLSAALVLASCVFLIDGARRPARFALNFSLATSAFALAMLAHGAAGFAAPVVIILGVIAYRGQSARWIVGWTAAAVGIAGLIYAPWMAYQRLADPPGDRLVKWHLAGVVGPDARSFVEAIVDSYGGLTIGEWWDARLANIRTVVDLNPLAGLPSIAERRADEFFITSIAVGLAYPIGVGVLVLVATRIVRTRQIALRDRPFVLLVGSSFACVLLWCVLMFAPGSTIVHQGSQVWVFFLTVAPTIWLALRYRRLATAVVAAQAVVTALVYVPTLSAGHIYPVAVAGLVVGVAACVGSALLAYHPAVLRRSLTPTRRAS